MRFQNKKIIFLISTLTIIASGYAAAQPLSEPQTLSLAGRVDYLAIPMPNNQPDLGIAGLHLLHPLDRRKIFYGGFGIYSAMTGQYNGFFSLGIDLGLQHQFARYVGVDAGIYTGASGVHGLGGAQIGDGPLMIAHAGLIFYIKKLQFNLADSYTQFFEGEKISGQALWFALTVPVNFCSFEKWDDVPTSFRAARSPTYVGIPVSLYIPQDAYFADGSRITETMVVTGAELGHQIREALFYYLGVENAVSGTTIGFSVVKGGVELINLPALPKPFFTDFRLGILSAGGNAVNSGGGFSGEAQGGIGVFVTKKISLRWLAGYLSAFQKRYHDVTTSLAIDYHFAPLTLPGDELISRDDIHPDYFRIRLDNQTYFLNQTFSGASSSINSFNVKIDDVITTHWFLTGQGSFSYSGIPGCYATGLLGGGYQIPIKARWLTYVSAMAGGGSGGATSLGQGVLLQGSLGALFHATPNVDTVIAISKAGVVHSSFAPWVLDAGLSFNVNFLS